MRSFLLLDREMRLLGQEKAAYKRFDPKMSANIFYIRKNTEMGVLLWRLIVICYGWLVVAGWL